MAGQDFINDLIDRSDHCRGHPEPHSAEKSRPRVQGLLPVSRRKNPFVSRSAPTKASITASAAAPTAPWSAFSWNMTGSSSSKPIEELASYYRVAMCRASAAARSRRVTIGQHQPLYELLNKAAERYQANLRDRSGRYRLSEATRSGREDSGQLPHRRMRHPAGISCSRGSGESGRRSRQPAESGSRYKK